MLEGSGRRAGRRPSEADLGHRVVLESDRQRRQVRADQKSGRLVLRARR